MEQRDWQLPAHVVATGGIVLNENNEVLLVKTHRDGWVFPGGMVELGENLIEGLKREIREESGVEVSVGEVYCICSNTASYPGYNGVKTIPPKVIFDFICRKTGGDLCTSEENSETAWFTKEEALKAITSPTIIERYKAFLEYNGRPTYLSYVTKPQYRLDLKLHI